MLLNLVLGYCLDNSFLVPPYGQEEIEEIESIFERPHIRTGALFLDIQCEFVIVGLEDVLTIGQIVCLPRLGTLSLKKSMRGSFALTHITLKQSPLVPVSLWMLRVELKEPMEQATQ